MGSLSMQERDRVVYKTYSGSSQDLATGVSAKNGPGGWLVGWYYGNPDAATLDEGSPSITWGDPLVMYGAYLILVSGGLPTTDGGPVTVTITGTSLTEPGVRVPADTEVIVVDGVALNERIQTEKRWLGTVTITLSSAGAAAFSWQFNYGFAMFESFGGRHFEMDQVEIQGVASDDDDEFDLIFYRHNHTGWEFALTDWEMHGELITSLSYIYGPEVQLKKNQPFGGFKREIQQFFKGDQQEGLVIRMKTGSDKTVQNITVHLGAIV